MRFPRPLIALGAITVTFIVVAFLQSLSSMAASSSVKTTGFLSGNLFVGSAIAARPQPRPISINRFVGVAASEDNHPPIAEDDTLLVHGVTSLTSLLKNDSDPDFDPISIGGFPKLPQHGQIFSGFYHPDFAYTGADSFSYQVCDPHGACDTADVTVNVRNQEPIANSDSYPIHGRTTVGPLLLNDSDPDGDALTLTALITTPQHAAEFSNTPTQGVYNYSPVFGFTGQDGFIYKVCDSLGACATAAVTLNVTNAPPTPVNKVYAVRGNTNVGPLLLGDTDPEGDNINLNAFVTSPQHGGLFNTGTSDVFNYRPVAGFNGSDSFVYRVCDSLGACSTATVTLWVVGTGENYGACSPCSGGAIAVGGPVNVTNGNMYLQQGDYQLPGTGYPIDVTRTYNSGAQQIGIFGKGWSTAYDESVVVYDNSLVRFNQADGRAIYFGRPLGSAGSFTPVIGDFHGQLIQNGSGYTLTMKDGGVHQFSAGGKLISLTDRSNNTTALTYGGNGFLSSVTDAFGRVLTLTTNATGHVLSISDSLGAIASYTYGGSNQLLSVTYADNSAFQVSYDNNLRLLSVTDALGNIVEAHTYDAFGRALSSEKQGGVEHYALSYISATETDVTDALGQVTKYSIDKSKGRNVVTRVEGLCNCGGGSQVQTWNYDNQLNVIARIDALAHATTYTYDGDGNRLTATNATGTVSYSYNQFGQVLSRVDQLNGVTTNTYDSGGNLLTSKDALNNTTTFTYNARGQLLTTTDARGKVTTFTYDTVGNLTQSKDANNVITFYFYDARSRLTKVRDGLSRNTLYAYDAAGRLNKITHPDNSFVSFTYDLAGRRTTVTDERGNVTNYAYDGAYRLTSVTDALGHATNYSYDAMSNLARMTDAISRITNYDYDDFNRLVKITYPAATTGATRLFETLAYDVAANVTQRTDTAGRTATYAYDNVNRLASTTDANNKTTTFEYDALSRATALTDALNQRYQFAYDAVGRQTQITRGGVSMNYAYDAVGNVTQRTDYNGAVTNYAYDNLNRLTTITYPTRTVTYAYTVMSRLSRATNENGSVYIGYDNRYRVSSFSDPFYYGVSYNYDTVGNRTKLSLNGATYATYTYDAVNRLTSLKDSANLNFPHTYDAINRLTTRSAPNGVTSSYAYDGLDRLTTLTHATSANTLINNQYTYNDASNIATWNNASGNHAYGYDPVDRLTSATNNAQPNENYTYDGVGNRTSSHLSASYAYQPFNKLTSSATASYTYDNNGNLLSKTVGSGATTFSWNEENQLTQVGLPGGLNVNYKYDALGRRIQRTTSAGANERYVYDGQDALLDLNADWTVAAKYLNEPGIDSHIRQTSSTTGVSYFLTDHLGSTAALTDATGNTVEQQSYDSFGSSAGSARTRYGYTGRERDPDAGLLYYRARFYDPGLGRFISEDPIRLAGGLNLYAYVGNGPINGSDPLGLHNEDVHYYLTYFLATRFPCLNQHEARLIADADQGIDENPGTEPWIGWDSKQGQTNSDNHAFNPGNSDLGSLRDRAMNGGTHYVNFGTYLHYLQDSFSHKDYSNSFIGQFGSNGTDIPFFGGFFVDNTNHNVGKSAQMAAATWFAIRDWIKAHKCKCGDQGDTNVQAWWPQVMEFLNKDNSDIEGKRRALGVALR